MRLSAGALPVLALLTASVLWASSFVALKVAFRHYDPMIVIFGRMLVASLCFLALWKNFRNIKYQKGDWKPLTFMALCEPCFYFIFEAKALENTHASQAGMIVSLLPLIVAVGAHFVLKEHISRRTLAGFALAVVGAVLLSAGAEADESAPNPVLGNFLEFLAMVCAAGYMIMLKRMCVRYPPLFLTAVQAVQATLFYFPLLFLPSTAPPQGFFTEGILAIVYLGAFITLGGYGLYNYGSSKIPAHQASAFTNTIPVLTLFMSWFFLGETLTGAQYLASGLVLAGVVLSQDRSKKSATKASVEVTPPQ
ncbi:MAG: DMT family transporter [Desulfovibrio sp.]|jgi:drug/metabolite transporter (DMT)-like permease